MFILDFKASRRKAFAHGFLKGMASPSMLYHRESLPDLPKVTQIKAPSYPIGEALAGDWVRIGNDLVTVIGKHGKATK